MTDTNPELDELIDNLWGRALDMTSPDFSNDEDYLLAQTNYRELCKKEFKKFFSQHEQEAEDKALKYAKGLSELFDNWPEQQKYVINHLNGDYYRSHHKGKKVSIRSIEIGESKPSDLSPTQEKRQGNE